MIITAIRIAQLLIKKYRNELTDQERMELEHWRKSNPRHSTFEENLLSSKPDQEEIAWLTNLDTQDAWKKVQKKRPKSRGLRYWGMAASLVLTCGIGYYLWSQQHETSPETNLSSIAIQQDVAPALLGARIIMANGEEKQVDEKLSINDSIFQNSTIASNAQQDATPTVALLNTLVVPTANHFQLTLSDGTSVWVNAGSELKFPTKFEGDSRKVYLKGEAYFEVAKNANKPFYVITENSSTRVLGTHFNVSAYGRNAKTTLAEGSVEVSSDSQQQLISPGQSAEVRANAIVVRKANLQKDLAWKNNEFYFKGDNIVDIANQLKLWYNLDISFASNVSLTETYSGEIRRDAKLSEVITMLEFVSDLHFSLEENKLKITKK